MCDVVHQIVTVTGVIVGISIILYFVREYFQGGQFKKDNVRMDGKVVIVTGANSGIGKATALDLARRGAKVYMACRDFNRCEEARLEIIAKTSNQNVFNCELDLASMDSIRKFAAKFIVEEKKLDVLINNAGVMICPKSYTKDGFETHIGVNYMGHFLLTNLLLDLLKKSAPSRIIIMSSMVYIIGRINKDDLNSEKSYNRIKAYCQSKLANLLFARHLAKKLEGTKVTVNALHPGSVTTNLTRYFPRILIILGRPFSLIFSKTPKSGAQTQIRLAVDPDLDVITGKYFSDCKEQSVGVVAQDDKTAEWLWKESEAWTKLTTKKEN